MTQPKKILIVDDENFIRLLLSRTLEDFEFEGVKILLAETGEQGLEIAIAEQPDLVFLDLMMPGIDGLEVCRRIRETPSLTQIYVVLLTAKGNVAIDASEMGPDCCLTKPFDPDQIIALTSEILGIEIDDGY
jgi:two-component system alkaline phosphatase synthesis response regulator PhoP